MIQSLRLYSSSAESVFYKLYISWLVLNLLGVLCHHRKRYKVNIKYHKEYMNNAGWKI